LGSDDAEFERRLTARDPAERRLHERARQPVRYRQEDQDYEDVPRRIYRSRAPSPDSRSAHRNGRLPSSKWESYLGRDCDLEEREERLAIDRAASRTLKEALSWEEVRATDRYASRQDRPNRVAEDRYRRLPLSARDENRIRAHRDEIGSERDYLQRRHRDETFASTPRVRRPDAYNPAYDDYDDEAELFEAPVGRPRAPA